MSPNDRKSLQTPIATIASEHRQYLERALINLVNTGIAFETYAQVVDGQPTAAVWQQYRNGLRRIDLEHNLEPSQDARHVVEAFRTNWDVQAININAQVAQAYQDAPIGSRAFNLHLVEIVVVISHDIAALLFESSEGGLQKPDLNRSDNRMFPGMELVKLPPKPSLLFHGDYMNYEDYPRGVSDVVGYWAEYRLYGGVVLFDRGSSGIECNDVFIHPIGSYRIFQVSELQIQQLLDFLLSAQPTSSPAILPICAEKYARRIDPYESMSLNIYRDKYERRIPADRPVRCVVHGEDFPELMDAYEDWNKRLESRRTN